MSYEVAAQGGKNRFRYLLIFLVIISVLLFNPLTIRIFFYQPFNIPSGAMSPTLLVGDYIFVSKFSYGYSKYTLPWLQEDFQGRLWGASPQRGDVAVFKLPRDNKTDYIKRVIGLPGDRIKISQGILYINGEAVQRRKIEDFALSEPNGAAGKIDRYVETLPNGVSYEVLDLMVGSTGDDTSEYSIPAGHYFMMGDHRDNSADSRWSGNFGVGYVPEENFVGRADVIFWSLSERSSFFAPIR